MKRPRLCFVGWADHVHVERWAGYFARAGYDVSVISFSGPGRYPEGVRQHSVGLAGRGPRWVEAKLRYLFWRVRPDLVHVHWSHFAVPVRNAWRGPLVVTAWGSDIYRRENFSDRQWTEQRDALAAANLVTADSSDLVRTIHDELGVDERNIAVVQWGVDTESFVPSGPDLRTELGLVGREVVFSVRNFTPLYNQETVVEAFSLLHGQRPATFLLMKSYGGEPGYLDRIRSLISAKGLDPHCRIVDTVPYEQMPALYRTADVTISIPFSDATPMSLLEAMATGSVPVVSDLPSLREWVRPGETGFLVDPKDPAAVAQALVGALGSPQQRQAIREAGRNLVVAVASQSAHMDAMSGRYAALAASR